jgi:hypothetical protein
MKEIINLRLGSGAILQRILGSRCTQFPSLSPDVIQAQLQTGDVFKVAALHSRREWSLFATFQETVEEGRLGSLSRRLSWGLSAAGLRLGLTE